VKISEKLYRACELCPRRCKADRLSGQRGFCGETGQLYVARAALHFWEEPPLSGTKGSGAIFFSGCPLRCVFCQNDNISHGNLGHPITVRRLAKIMLELKDQGALNINLVTPFHFAPQVHEALMLAKEAGLKLPIVANTSGYELPELVDAMAPDIDIWLTDFKYASPELAQKLSGARNYPAVALEALKHMYAATEAKGVRKLEDSGRMLRGIIVRHLVLPTHIDDSMRVLDTVFQVCGNKVDYSIMNQYTPNERCKKRGGALSHALGSEEYEKVLDHADDLGIDRMWWQQGGTVSESFIPAFDATGVDGPELKIK